AHRLSIVHRDLKPANIRVTSEGEVRVMDWGLAKPVDEIAPEKEGALSLGLLKPLLQSNLTIVGGAFGTPGYIAPERHRADFPGDPRAADIFALGAILYEMATGRHPFVTDWSPEKIEDNYLSTHPNRIQAPPAFRDVVEGDFPPYFYRIEEVARRAID